MIRAFRILCSTALLGLLPGLTAAADLATASRPGGLQLDRRSLAASPDLAVPRMAGTVSRTRIAAEGWQHCALSFDDGPNEITPRILAILAHEQVRATYFPVANVAQRHPEVIRAFVAAGHEIGNHSLRHANLSKMTPAAARADLAEANRILSGLGARPALFRPPYAGWNTGVAAAAQAAGLEMVLWSLDVRDWEYRDAGMLAARVKAGAGPAMVVLLHATYEWTATALPEIITALRNQGCHFVTLSDWLAFMRGDTAIVQAPAEAPVRPITVAETVTPAPAPVAPAITQAPAAAPPAPTATPPRWVPGPAPVPSPAPAQAAAKPAPVPAAKPAPAVILRPATLAKRNNKTEVTIEGDDMTLSLGPDADIDAIAARVKEALERPRVPKPDAPPPETTKP
ncbi:MAG: polysaccharide deacetylase family protein [Alphaproteobacteria bacterium]|nr:polysaccharide deacetylase family protein [Alphaproteobacteria bacterium]